MDDAQGLIAFRHGIEYDPCTQNIINVLKGDALAFELVVHTVYVLDTTLYLGLEPHLHELMLNPAHDILEVFLLFLCNRIKLCLEGVVSCRIEVFQAQFLEFHLKPVNTEPVSERRIDLQGFPGNTLLRVPVVKLKGSHIVQAVDELDKKDPQILAHGQDHLAEIFGLLLFFRAEIDLADLGEPVNNERHFIAEFRSDVFHLGKTVFYGVMEKCRCYRGNIELHLCDEMCNL